MGEVVVLRLRASRGMASLCGEVVVGWQCCGRLPVEGGARDGSGMSGRSSTCSMGMATERPIREPNRVVNRMLNSAVELGWWPPVRDGGMASVCAIAASPWVEWWERGARTRRAELRMTDPFDSLRTNVLPGRRLVTLTADPSGMATSAVVGRMSVSLAPVRMRSSMPERVALPSVPMVRAASWAWSGRPFLLRLLGWASARETELPALWAGERGGGGGGGWWRCSWWFDCCDTDGLVVVGERLAAAKMLSRVVCPALAIPAMASRDGARVSRIVITANVISTRPQV